MRVPGIRMVDAREGILGLEWIEGKSVRRLLPGGEEEDEVDGLAGKAIADDLVKEYNVSTGIIISCPSLNWVLRYCHC